MIRFNKHSRYCTSIAAKTLFETFRFLLKNVFDEMSTLFVILVVVFGGLVVVVAFMIAQVGGTLIQVSLTDDNADAIDDDEN